MRSKMKKCPCCKGVGSLPGLKVVEEKLRHAIVECKFCKGTGKVTKKDFDEEKSF